jgi:hypothetical protein
LWRGCRLNLHNFLNVSRASSKGSYPAAARAIAAIISLRLELFATVLARAGKAAGCYLLASALILSLKSAFLAAVPGVLVPAEDRAVALPAMTRAPGLKSYGIEAILAVVIIEARLTAQATITVINPAHPNGRGIFQRLTASWAIHGDDL